MLNNDFLDQKAKQFHIDRSVVIREYLQLLFLKYFYQKDLSIYFKGGTAIRFLFNSFRFSEDLDFTCQDKKIDIENYIKTFVGTIEKESGFKTVLEKIQEYKDVGTRYGLKFLPNQLIKQTLRIKLDFSTREKPLDPVSGLLMVTDYPVSPLPIVSYFSKTEILAEKIRAIFTRNQPRDIFDLWFLLKQETVINWPFVEKKMTYYPKVKYSYNLLLDIIKKTDPDMFKRDLNQFLPEQYRKIYPLLLSEIIELLKAKKNLND